jgi:ribose transport system ATP-binding protein
MGYIVELKEIVKNFPGVCALNKVSFNLKAGEVHILLGENGAGKSTLMKVLSGNYHPDSGTIMFDGVDVGILSPKKAQDLGISIIHQEFNLVPQLTVAQNIFLGHELDLGFGGLVDYRKQFQRSKELLNQVGLDLDPNQKVAELSVAQQQLVELAKALSLKVKILIMDEPTATLSTREITLLFQIINKLKTEGVGIIYISHRLPETHQIGDRVTVLRDGESVGTRNVNDVSLDQLVQMMVGRSLNEMFVRNAVSEKQGRPLMLKAENITVSGLLDQVSLKVYEGEIVGLAGLVGSGRTELAKTIFGAIPIDSGRIEIFGEEVRPKSPQQLIEMGVGLLPEDRKSEGVIQNLSIRQNVTMASLKKMFPTGILSLTREIAESRQQVSTLRIMTDSIEKLVRFLSGGNQQKVVVGKWLCRQPRLLIFDEPTRGVDVGAKAEIHRIMDDLVQNGVSVLMISSELPEVLGMSDRIYVMREGKIVKELLRAEASQEIIIRYAMGGEASEV